MRRALAYAVAAVLLGALGFLLTQAAEHLYTDHQRVDQIWDLELRRAQAAQAAAPTPGGK